MDRKHRIIRSGAATVATLALLATTSPASFASTSSDSTATTGQQWSLSVGGSTSDGAFQAMAFFPNVITVDAGDTVNFKLRGNSPHTVSFAGSDGKYPSPMDPNWDQPAGGNTYDGSAFTSSGMIMPGQAYSLTFTKPGVYTYKCLMHSGMQGVVIVQPSGTPYPMTQSQYDTLAAQESQADLTAAQSAAASVNHLSRTTAANGTTVWKVQADLPEASTYSLDLSTNNNSGATGTATFTMGKPETWNIAVKLSGLTPGKTYSPALSVGKSNSGTFVDGSQFSSFVAGPDGTADVTGTVAAAAIPQGIWFVDVNNSNGSAVASGVVNYLSFTDERYLPKTVDIHVGDTVEWTQWGPNEAHTISFLPSTWSDVPNEGLMVTPAGDSVYSGDKYYNSGLLFPGQTYSLTFATVGDFQYRCLLHDVMGMYGKVNVLPHNAVIVNVDGEGVDTGLSSFIENDRAIVPMRSVLETLGATVTWDSATKTVTATKGSTTIVVQIGSKSAKINDQTVQLAVAAELINGHVYIPVRIVDQAFGYQLSWDQSVQTVSIATK